MRETKLSDAADSTINIEDNAGLKQRILSLKPRTDPHHELLNVNIFFF